MAELGVDRGFLSRGWLWIKYGGEIAVVGAVITAGAVVGGVVHETSGGSGGGSGGIANLWIDTNGGTCSRSATPITYSDAAACGTFRTAYLAASVGDTVRIQAGSYPAETIPYTDGKANGLGHCDWSSNNSLLAPVPDYTGCITFDPATTSTAVTVASLGVNVPYVRLRSLTFTAGFSFGGDAPAGTGAGTCSQYKDHDQVADGITVTNGTFFIAADHAILTNSTINYGNTDLAHEKSGKLAECQEVSGATFQRSWMAIIHNRFQNLIQTQITDGVNVLHLEAIHVIAGQHVIVARNTFYNNAGHNLSMQCGLYDDCHDWIMQNNFFDTICSHQVTQANGGTCTRGGSDGFSCGNHSIVDASILFNTYLADYPEYIGDPTGCAPGIGISGTMVMAGNLALSLTTDFNCSQNNLIGVQMDNYNVWHGPSGPTIVRCGSTNIPGGTAGFVDPAAGDLHITSASSANNYVPTTVTGGCPTIDIDGQARPIDGNCDAGADER